MRRKEKKKLRKLMMTRNRTIALHVLVMVGAWHNVATAPFLNAKKHFLFLEDWCRERIGQWSMCDNRIWSTKE